MRNLRKWVLRMRKYRIILVEDDEEAGFYTQEFLEDFDFDVDVFTLATDAIANIKYKKYDILLLDLNLPDFDGFEVLKAIKNLVAIPTIVISAHSDIKTKLKAFKLGALDYIVKPYNLEELEARIWVAFGKGNVQPKDKDTFYIDEKHILFKDEVLKLTQIEFGILQMLIKNKNSITTRDALASSLSTISSQRSLDYHIKNIRKKIDDNGLNSKYLKTEYGVGYILTF